MADGVTWYDILGISPGASSETVRRAYLDKARQLASSQIAGVPPEVSTAAARGRMAIDAAWLILGDTAEREQYDEQIGPRCNDTGLLRRGPSLPGTALDRLVQADVRADALLAALGALAGRLAAKRARQPRRVTVPDIRGLFFGPCQEIVSKAGFRIRTVVMTDHPMPVDGLVVEQSPAPGRKVRRSSTLTVQVWHPPRPRRWGR